MYEKYANDVLLYRQEKSWENLYLPYLSGTFTAICVFSDLLRNYKKDHNRILNIIYYTPFS